MGIMYQSIIRNVIIIQFNSIFGCIKIINNIIINKKIYFSNLNSEYT